jgi:hypothetical protein
MLRKVMYFFMFAFLFILIGCTKQPHSQNKMLKKVALIIGNQDYVGNKLDNPRNDAIGMKKSLKKIGFEVTLALDSTLVELNRTLEQLESNIEANNTIVFIYFAGHGNTLHENSSEQFLMMTDKEKPVLVSIFKFYDFLKRVEARHSIISLDACRDYQKHYISIGRTREKNFRGNFSLERFRAGKIRSDDGFKKDVEVFIDKDYDYKLPNSILVSYSTHRNEKAKDWSVHDEKHSPYS